VSICSNGCRCFSKHNVMHGFDPEFGLIDNHQPIDSKTLKQKTKIQLFHSIYTIGPLEKEQRILLGK
jgi:hypothetical protein